MNIYQHVLNTYKDAEAEEKEEPEPDYDPFSEQPKTPKDEDVEEEADGSAMPPEEARDALCMYACCMHSLLFIARCQPQGFLAVSTAMQKARTRTCLHASRACRMKTIV
jgi:hypothetical protein